MIQLKNTENKIDNQETNISIKLFLLFHNMTLFIERLGTQNLLTLNDDS